MMSIMSSKKRISELISLKGKTSIVTGGAGHLGTAISEALAELGSDMLILGKKKEEGSSFVKHLSQEFNINAEFEEVDINSKESLDSFFDKKKHNASILVNNAFTWPSILKMEETSW